VVGSGGRAAALPPLMQGFVAAALPENSKTRKGSTGPLKVGKHNQPAPTYFLRASTSQGDNWGP